MMVMMLILIMLMMMMMIHAPGGIDWLSHLPAIGRHLAQNMGKRFL